MSGVSGYVFDLFRPCRGLSRRRQGFESPWGRQKITKGYGENRDPFFGL
jgi:hypothetical protein